MPRNSEMKDLRQRLVDQGFQIRVVKNGHWQVVAPDGRKCQIASTPKYSTGVLNAITRLKRIGYCPPSKKSSHKTGRKAVRNT